MSRARDIAPAILDEGATVATVSVKPANHGSRMTEPTLELTDAPDDEAARVIDGGLAAFNAANAGYWDWRPLAVLLRDPADGDIVGGLLGRTSLGLLFVDLVFIPERLRGKALGARMLQMAEQEAARRGCRGGMLYTISFQAPGFYERHGWREFGRIDCDPPGTARIFMTKAIAPAASQERS